MVIALDRNEYGQTETDLVLVDQRYPPGDNALAFHALDPLPAWCGGQPHAFANLCDG
jgi:hypothetical protein